MEHRKPEVPIDTMEQRLERLERDNRRWKAMTTLAMGAGMMPIALGFSGDSSFRAPMAIAVIGGLITSTLLSLIVIPAAFTVIDDLGEWVTRRFHRRGAHPAT